VPQTNPAAEHVRHENDETYELRRRHEDHPECLRPEDPPKPHDRVRIAEPTEIVVKTQLPPGERREIAHRDEKGRPDHVVFFHHEPVDPVDQNQSSDSKLILSAIL
jgi:hypothetical protein